MALAASAGALLLLATGAPARAYSCPPLATCFPKPVPVLDVKQLGLAGEAIAAGESALQAWSSARLFTQNLQTALGGPGTPSLPIAADLSLARSLLAAAPAKIPGPGGNGFDIGQSTLRMTQARIDTLLYTARSDVAPVELGTVAAARLHALRNATGEALATALVRRAALRLEPKEIADIRAARAAARSLREDVAANQRARLALVRRYDEAALVLTRYLELAAAGRLATQPPALAFPAAARLGATSSVAAPQTATATQLRMQEALRRGSNDTARRRMQDATATALLRGSSAAIAAAATSSSRLRDAFPDSVQAQTPSLDAGLVTLYADPAGAKRVLFEIAAAGAGMAGWAQFSTAALADSGAAAAAGETDLRQTWTRSVTAADTALAALAKDPRHAGELLVAPDEAAAFLATLRQGDALAELANWAQSGRLAPSNIELRGWLDDAAQLAREAAAR